jgi:hypothetical protein
MEQEGALLKAAAMEEGERKRKYPTTAAIEDGQPVGSREGLLTNARSLRLNKKLLRYYHSSSRRPIPMLRLDSRSTSPKAGIERTSCHKQRRDDKLVKNVAAIERRRRSKAIDDNVFQRKSSTTVSTAGQASNNEDLLKNCQRMKQCAVDCRHFRPVLKRRKTTSTRANGGACSSSYSSRRYSLLELQVVSIVVTSSLNRATFDAVGDPIVTSRHFENECPMVCVHFSTDFPIQ